MRVLDIICTFAQSVTMGMTFNEHCKDYFIVLIIKIKLLLFYDSFLYLNHRDD